LGDKAHLIHNHTGEMQWVILHTAVGKQKGWYGTETSEQLV